MKSTYQKYAGIFLLLALIFTLTACTAAPAAQPAEPTADLNVVRTEAVQTAVAQITLEAAMNPTDEITEEAPTATEPPAPTATTAAVEPTVIPTFTPAPTLVPQTSSQTNKPAPTANTYTDQALVMSTSPEDYTIMQPYQDFDAVWVVKNVGRRAWNSDFYFTGTDLNGNSFGPIYFSNPNLAVNDTVKIVLDMTAPAYVEGGKNTHTAYVHIFNDDGVNFYSPFLIITVAKP